MITVETVLDAFLAKEVTRVITQFYWREEKYQQGIRRRLVTEGIYGVWYDAISEKSHPVRRQICRDEIALWYSTLSFHEKLSLTETPEWLKDYKLEDLHFTKIL